MNLNPIEKTAQDMEALYQATMDLYDNYFRALTALIEQTPNDDVGKLIELNNLAREAESALQTDMSIFDKAISMDAEGLASMKDALQIQSIQNKLKN